MKHPRHIEMGSPLKLHEMLAVLIFTNNEFYENMCSNDMGTRESLLTDYVSGMSDGKSKDESSNLSNDTSLYLKYR